MDIQLTEAEKSKLEKQHRTERDGRMKDRIKAVLLKSEGWAEEPIAQALRVHSGTVHRHLEDYAKELKLAPGNGGSVSRLTEEQRSLLISHLYRNVKDICAYVFLVFSIEYSVAGMTQWLHRHSFVYKKPKGFPAKANGIQQAEKYERLMTQTPEDEPILFGDGVHPTMATKTSYGWIGKGFARPIATVACRSRLNIFGALNLQEMSLVSSCFQSLNQESMGAYFRVLRNHYPRSPRIHLIVDQGSYNRSLKTQEAARELGVLHYLPPYSPNLNPNERVWKRMNERVRNNVSFRSFAEFQEAILSFLNETWGRLAHTFRDRVNDNFQILNFASSG